jgi:hypothetical protein
MNIKKLTPRMVLFFVVALTCVAVNAQAPPREVNVTIRQAQSPEERVKEEEKLKDLRKAAEEKRAADDAARIAETSPRKLLANARIFLITSNSEFFEAVQFQNALRKRPEFELWEMAIVDGWEHRDVADIVIEVDRPLFTYTFTYQVTNRRNGIVLATGKVTAWDANAAAPKLASRLIDEIRTARGEAKPKK